jgi:hypothetical protein
MRIKKLKLLVSCAKVSYVEEADNDVNKNSALI